ncbi:MAG: nucleoside triphosphate pyrophosphohydrolase [Anaerolineae bacterium]|nr:nucleoside triphosphate pyrophosphohydrolase [Anaerolineae bacterium]
MSGIVILGLGPGALDQLTREAWSILTTAGEIWLRTTHHPLVAELPQNLQLHSFDALYEQLPTFEQIYTAIVDEVLALGQREHGVIYATPGHPLIAEATVPEILARARAAALPVRVVAGLSFIEPTLTALEAARFAPPQASADALPAPSGWRDAVEGLQLADALEVLALDHPPFRPDAPALIAQVYSRSVASELKLTLMNEYPDEHPVALIEAAGTAAQSVTWLPLYAIDRQEVGPLSTLYLAPMDPGTSLENFQATIAHLRSPEGCPWDREQTHGSLRTNLLEETYEVLDAIDREDIPSLREELGDLLLQIVLHTQIATEDGDFQMHEVLAGIDAKIKHRHPHVWGAAQVTGATEVIRNWETLKRREREANGQAERSLLDGVPTTLPALAQAHAYSSRAKRVGFDWDSIEGVRAKVAEEFAELDAATSPEERAMELGDVLAVLANLARWLDIDPESALRESNQRFARRFRRVEALAREQGLLLENLGSEALDQLWRIAKTQV